jgi:L,D-transpeptidase catalytic domain
MVGALGLLALALAVGGWAVTSGGGSGASTAPPTVVVAPGAGPAGGEHGDPAVEPRQSPGPSATEPRSNPAQPEAQPREGAPRAAPRRRASSPPELISTRGHPIVWLRRGEAIAVRTAPGGKVVKRLRWRTQFGSRTVLSVFARRGRWAGVSTPLLPNGRLGWVKLDPRRLQSGWTRYSIDVDLSSEGARLVLGRRVVRSFSVTVGSPASPTPTGRFAITDMFRGNLNPAYGCCALATSATQPNLPSGWLGGDRIAIHGTTGPLGAAISHGCIRAANADVDALVSRVGLGTPIVIHE